MDKPITININSLVNKVIVNGSSQEEIAGIQKIVTEVLTNTLNSVHSISVPPKVEPKLEVSLHLQKLVDRVEITVLPCEDSSNSSLPLEKQIELAQEIASKSIQRLIKVVCESASSAHGEINHQDSDH